MKFTIESGRKFLWLFPINRPVSYPRIFSLLKMRLFKSSFSFTLKITAESVYEPTKEGDISWHKVAGFSFNPFNRSKETRLIAIRRKSEDEMEIGYYINSSKANRSLDWQVHVLCSVSVSDLKNGKVFSAKFIVNEVGCVMDAGDVKAFSSPFFDFGIKDERWSPFAFIIQPYGGGRKPSWAKKPYSLIIENFKTI